MLDLEGVEHCDHSIRRDLLAQDAVEHPTRFEHCVNSDCVSLPLDGMLGGPMNSSDFDTTE